MIDHLLERKKTGMQYPRERDCGVVAVYDEQNDGPCGQRDFGCVERNEYTMSLTVKVSFLSNDVELPRKDGEARRMLKHALFKDVESALYEALNSTDNPQTVSILASLIAKIRG